jgi:hypothetical protein
LLILCLGEFMQATGGNSKAVYYVIGGAVLFVLVLFIIVKLNEISQRVDAIAEKQDARPLKDSSPIDVIPEVVAESVPPAAIVTANPVNLTNLTDSRIHSAESRQSDQIPQIAPKSPGITYAPESEVHSDQSADSHSESSLRFRHSEDFRTIYHKGREYHLTLNQARIVERLWNAHQNKTPEVHQSTLLEKLEIYSRRVRDVFKNSPALYSLVIRGEKKGTFRLNLA